MREPRVFLDATLAQGARVTIPEAPMRHLVQVLRLGAGSRVRLFDGRGAEFAATLETIGKRDAVALLGAAIEPAAESRLSIVLAQSISKGDRMDYTLQKAVELGVTAIQPLVTSRSIVRLDAERQDRKHEHWAGIVASACEQSGRATLPALRPVKSLEAWLADPADGSLRLTLDPLAERGPRAFEATQSVTLLVGPEGGLSSEEIVYAKARGFRGMRLGPRILRTETAGVAAMSALQVLWGDLGA